MVTHQCLHCAVLKTVEQWAVEHGKKQNGLPVLDLPMAIEKMADVIVELSLKPADLTQRQQMFRYAHAALDAHLESARTGGEVTIQIPGVH